MKIERGSINLVGPHCEWAITQAGKRVVMLIDHDDAADLMKRFTSLFVVANRYATYIRASKPGYRVMVHTHLLGPTDGQIVDHINGNGLDNRRCNLRVVTRSINCHNLNRLKSVSATGYRGIVRQSDRFVAAIWKSRRRIYREVFNTLDDALTGYLAALKGFDPVAHDNYVRFFDIRRAA